MKPKNYINCTFLSSISGMFLFLCILFIGCKKDVKYESVSLTDMASNIKITHADTSLILSWDPGLLAWEGDGVDVSLKYEVQISSDSTFSAVSNDAYNALIDSAFLYLGEEQIVPLQEYFARVRAVASTGKGESRWVTSEKFHILDELPEINLFRTIKIHQLTDQGIYLNWESNDELTRLIVSTEDESEIQEFDLSPAEGKEGNLLVEGLDPSQAYVARLFKESRPMGVLEFTTKESIEGKGFIDLRESSDPMILQNTLNTVAEGSTIVLNRGMTYTITETFKLDRGVTVMSYPGFGPQAHIEMSSSFDVSAPGSVELIRFEDLNITGEQGSTYVFNLSSSSDIKKIEFEGCLIEEHRGVMRMKDAGLKVVDQYVINNSIVQNIGNYNVLTVDHNDAKVNDVRLSKSSFINLMWILRFGGAVTSDLRAIDIEDVTFYNAPSDNRYVVDNMRGTATNGLTIRNTIFGYSDGARAINRNNISQITVVNSFATQDFGTTLVEGVTPYSANSNSVFAKPNNDIYAESDLTIIDKELFTVGDPRWRP
ncbi:MAG TPA: DUF5123 domain-containing protein [Candidatus Sphingobacterium stercoripullorum]|nr:DUF5123 domain-containing protein [Candidatus Sphingobacterium stercoripullorum]